jgi:hypothetical protein
MTKSEHNLNFDFLVMRSKKKLEEYINMGRTNPKVVLELSDLDEQGPYIHV